MAEHSDHAPPRRKWPFFKKSSAQDTTELGGTERLATWNMGMLNDKETIAVPGMISLFSTPVGLPGLC